MDPFTLFQKMFDKVWLAMQDYFLNYTFGIVAVVFAIRAVSTFITKGEVSIISIIIALICGTMAASMGQDIWTDFFELIKSAF